jgi:hypothetical protein
MRTLILVLFGLLSAMLWLVLLELSAFNLVTVSLGLMVVLAINPATKRAARW